MTKRKKAYAEATKPKKPRVVQMGDPPRPASHPALERTGPLEPPYLPIEVPDLLLAFPTNGYHRLPPREAFEKVERRWVHFVEQWFYNGAGKASDHIVAKEGIDMVKAVRHLKSVMGGFDTKHEDKINGVAFLMQTWFDWKEKTDG